MSPKRQIALLVAVFATLGIGVSAGIVAAGGGGQINLFHPPSDKDIFHVGQDVRNGTTLAYTLNSVTPQSTLKSSVVVLQFQNQTGHWTLHVSVTNGTQPAQQEALPMSTVLTLMQQPSSSFRPYFDPVRLSVFSIRDMSYESAEKYLYVGAPWNSIDTGTLSVIARITGKETIQTPAGTFDTFVLSYKLGSKTSMLWISPQVPLPVKAQVYDAFDNPQYSFELIRFTP